MYNYILIVDLFIVYLISTIMPGKEEAGEASMGDEN